MKVRKGLAVLLAMTMLTAVATGCGGKTSSASGTSESSASGTQASESGTPSDHLTIGIAADVESFNPWLMANDSRQQVFYNSIYEPLARLTLEGERELVLAKSLEDMGDGVYRIVLYDNIYDSAGNQITADDVIFSYDQCNQQGALSWGIKYLDHFDKIDDYTLDMHLNEESAVALDMVLKTCFIVDQEAYEASGDGFASSPIGTGPYTLESYTPGSEVVITARDDYWQTDESLISTAAKLGSVKTVTYKVITDTSQLALALEMGDIDVSGNIQTADLNNFLNDDRTAKDGFNVEAQLSPLVHFIAFNCSENSPCADQNVRQAISYALDMPAITQNVYGSDASVAMTNSSPYYNDYDPALEETVPYDYDPEKAKELLAEAGYEDGDLNLTLIYTTEYNRAQVVPLIQSYLKAVGINVELQVMEAANFNASINDPSAFDMYLNTVMSLNTPGRLGLMDMNGYTTGMNGVFVTDEELQSKFDAANLAATYSTETVTDLLNYIEEKDYVYPTYYMYQYVITNDRVTDIVLDRNFALIPGASTIVDK